VLLLAAWTGSAQAHTTVVGPSVSIPAAIDAAKPGAVILVAGVHKEDAPRRRRAPRDMGPETRRSKASSPPRFSSSDLIDLVDQVLPLGGLAASLQLL